MSVSTMQYPAPPIVRMLYVSWSTALLVLLETKLLLFNMVITLAGAWILLKLYENYAPPGLMMLKHQLEHFVL